MRSFKTTLSFLLLSTLLISCKDGVFAPKGVVSGKITVFDEYGESPSDNSKFNMVLDDGKKKWQTSTLKDGSFEFKDIPRGTYKFYGSKLGYKILNYNVVVSHVGGDIATSTSHIFYQIAQTHTVGSLNIEPVKKSANDFDYAIKMKGSINPSIPDKKYAAFSLFCSLDPKVDSSSTFLMNIDAVYLNNTFDFGRTELSSFLNANKVKKQNIYFAIYQNAVFYQVFNSSSKITYPLLNTRGSNTVKVYIE